MLRNIALCVLVAAITNGMAAESKAGYTHQVNWSQVTLTRVKCYGAFSWTAANDADNPTYVTIDLYTYDMNGDPVLVHAVNNITTTKNGTDRTLTYSEDATSVVTSGQTYFYKVRLFSNTGVELDSGVTPDFHTQ